MELTEYQTDQLCKSLIGLIKNISKEYAEGGSILKAELREGVISFTIFEADPELTQTKQQNIKIENKEDLIQLLKDFYRFYADNYDPLDESANNFIELKFPKPNKGKMYSKNDVINHLNCITNLYIQEDKSVEILKEKYIKENL